MCPNIALAEQILDHLRRQPNQKAIELANNSAWKGARSTVVFLTNSREGYLKTLHTAGAF